MDEQARNLHPVVIIARMSRMWRTVGPEKAALRRPKPAAFLAFKKMRKADAKVLFIGI